MPGWRQQLLDGITQAFEDEATSDLVFVALLLHVSNLQ
jgi:hypothetical protein